MSESFAEKTARLQREIAQRQAELARLVLGDPMQSVSVPRGVDDKTPGRGYYEEDSPGYDEAS